MWSIPEIGQDAEIEFSSRMTRSLGRCYPSRGLVRLNHRLREAPDSLLREVLCHELAHLVVYVRFGASARPHGLEWQQLVRDAGFVPRRRAPHMVDLPPKGAAAQRSVLFEHRCPVCQSTRVARTATPRWRCAECVDDGLPGALEVSRIRPNTWDVE